MKPLDKKVAIGGGGSRFEHPDMERPPGNGSAVLHAVLGSPHPHSCRSMTSIAPPGNRPQTDIDSAYVPGYTRPCQAGDASERLCCRR